MDDQEYLESNFDPSSLTVPRLRSILVAHSVNYPSSAKKGQLIELFNEHVVPQARKIRSANARVKRTSKGITDVPASQVSIDDEDEELNAPPVTRGGGRRSTRARTEEAQEVVPTPKSTRHSTAPPESAPRRASSKHARTLDKMEDAVEPEPKRPASRKSRLSAQTPVAKAERAYDDDADDSPFSNDNVFQSGSSLPATEDRRRTTSGVAKDIDRRRSNQGRRRTEEVKQVRQADAVVVPMKKSFDMPVSAMKKRKDDIEPSEEFTREEQMELARAEHSGELVPTRPRSRRPASKTARTGVSAVLVALLGGIATLYSQEKFQVGYCGVGHASQEIAGVEIPEWADIVRPRCEPCPPHAVCHSDLRTTCEPDFELTPHPLSLNGLLPFPPTCVPDSVKAKKVERVKERAIHELREHNAKYECGDPVTPEIRESELKARVSSKRVSRMGDREFEDLWASAIGEISEAEEVVQSTDGSSGRLTLRSTSLARLPFSCALRRSLRETLREYFWQLVASLLTVSTLAYGRHYITSGRETEAKAKQLAGLALDRLSQQASLHASEPEIYRESYLPMAQLRDDVLRTEWSTFNRKKLWDEVQKKVERNANIRPMVREGRSGDVGRVWEWVGAIGMIESPGNGPNGEGERRKKSGRVSFGGERWIEPSSFEGSEMSEVRKWEEGRQYY